MNEYALCNKFEFIIMFIKNINCTPEATLEHVKKKDNNRKTRSSTYDISSSTGHYKSKYHTKYYRSYSDLPKQLAATYSCIE